VITATGRHIENVAWRPAVIVDDLPQPLSGAAATDAITGWDGARSCTDATAAPGPPLATESTETSPAPPAAIAELSVDQG